MAGARHHRRVRAAGEIRGQLVLGLVIPTLSQYGVIGLGLLLLGAMGVAISRRSAIST